MKIVQLSYSLSSGGAERFVVDLSNELSENGDNEIVLLTVDDDSVTKNSHYLSDVSPEVKYINLHVNNGGLSLKSFIRVYKKIKELQPDIVHVHCNLLLVMLSAFCYRKCIYVHTLHSLAEVCLKYKFLKYIYKYFYKNNLVYAITISKACQESYEKMYRLNNSTCILNGRSRPFISNKLEDVRMELSSYKQSPNSKIFVHVARCNPLKNQKLLFDTFSRLSSIHKECLLIVIGSGFEGSDFQKYQKCSNIYILGEKKNIGDYLSCADFFILSSIYEGLPLSLLEAMSLGVIPVSTPVGGIPDVIIDGKNGFLSFSCNNEDFYDAIVRALSSVDCINRENLKEEYEQKYSMSSCSKKYIQEYNRLL